jgi:hypothetical protein
MSSELQVSNQSGMALMSFQEMEKSAEVMAKSQLFPAWNTKEKMLSLMLLCRSEGIDPIRAVNRYDNIKGRVTKRAKAKLEDFFAAGGKVEWLESSDKCAKAIFTPPNGGKPLTHEYNWQDVVKAGNQSKDNYRNYPKEMLRARLVSGALEMVWPQAGGLMYTPEEVSDMDNGFSDTEEKNVTPKPTTMFNKTPVNFEKDVKPKAGRPKKHAETPPEPEVIDAEVVSETTITDENDNSEAQHPIYTLDADKAKSYLVKIKWLADGQELADLSKEHLNKIANSFESFKAKVEAM